MSISPIFVVDGKVIVELKACENLAEAHEAQLVNYLKATGMEVGLLFNFGAKPRFIRKAFSGAKTTETAELTP